MSTTSLPIFTSKTHTGNNMRETAMAAMLYQVLADEHRLFIFAKNCHWYVRDNNFTNIQRHYERFCMEMDIVIDAVFERVHTTGYYTAGLLQESLEDVKNEAVHYISSGKEQLQTLLGRHEILQEKIKRYLVTTVKGYTDACTSDFLTGLLHQHELWAQTLRTHLA